MPEFSNPTSLAIAITAIITFSLGIIAFLFLLGILSANRNVLTSRGRDAQTAKRLRRSIINFATLFASGSLVGTITLSIAYFGEGERIFVVSALLIAGALVSIESIVLFLLFLGQIVLAATPDAPVSGASRETTKEVAKQTGTILGGAVVSGFLLHLVYDTNNSFPLFQPPIAAKVFVKIITLLAGGLSLLTSLSAFFIIMALTLIGDRQHRINRLWVVFVVGIIIGGLLLYIAQLLS